MMRHGKARGAWLAVAGVAVVLALVTGAVAQQPKVVIAVTSPQSGPQAA
jgi:hypothetical protein